MTGTIKEYTPTNVLVLEDLAPSEPVQFKLAQNVTYADADGKPIEAAGLTTPKNPCPLHQSRRRQRGRQSHPDRQLESTIPADCSGLSLRLTRYDAEGFFNGGGINRK
jgi:hypothetical protein